MPVRIVRTIVAAENMELVVSYAHVLLYVRAMCDRSREQYTRLIGQEKTRTRREGLGPRARGSSITIVCTTVCIILLYMRAAYSSYE